MQRKMNPWLDILTHGKKVFVAGDVVKEDKVCANQTEDILKEKVMLANELVGGENKVQKSDKVKLEVSEDHSSQVSSQGLSEDDISLQEDFKQKANLVNVNQSISWNELEETEPKKPPEDDELKLEDIIKPLLKESAQRVDEFFLFLKDIHNLILKPKRQEVKELQDVIALVTSEIEETEKKNKELEKEIERLKKD